MAGFRVASPAGGRRRLAEARGRRRPTAKGGRSARSCQDSGAQAGLHLQAGSRAGSGPDAALSRSRHPEPWASGLRTPSRLHPGGSVGAGRLDGAATRSPGLARSHCRKTGCRDPGAPADAPGKRAPGTAGSRKPRRPARAPGGTLYRTRGPRLRPEVAARGRNTLDRPARVDPGPRMGGLAGPQIPGRTRPPHRRSCGSGREGRPARRIHSRALARVVPLSRRPGGPTAGRRTACPGRGPKGGQRAAGRAWTTRPPGLADQVADRITEAEARFTGG